MSRNYIRAFEKITVEILGAGHINELFDTAVVIKSDYPEWKKSEVRDSAEFTPEKIAEYIRQVLEERDDGR